MQSETNKFLTTNRGWISNKFALKNPVVHFLNIHKKKDNLSKTSMNNGSRFGSPQRQKSKFDNTKIEFGLTKSRLIPDHQGSKQKTEPINFSMLHPIVFDTQFQLKTNTIQQKRNKSLHLRKSKHIDDSINKLKNQPATPSKFKDERQIKTMSQRNFRVTNCGRYKPQLMFLKPQIRNGSPNAKFDKTKTYLELEQKKTSIYKNINRSLCVEERIDSIGDDKRSASFNNYLPIEYMTEYGEAHEEQPQTLNQISNKQHQKIVASFRRKPNIAVLKNKLNFQYKKSDYKRKISCMSIQPQFPLIDQE